MESTEKKKTYRFRTQLLCAPIIYMVFVLCFALNPVNVTGIAIVFAAIIGTMLLLPVMTVVWALQWGTHKLFSKANGKGGRFLTYLPTILVCIACVAMLFDNPRDWAIQNDLGISSDHPGIRKGKFRQMMGFNYFRAGELEVTPETLEEILSNREYSDVDIPRPAAILSYYQKAWGFTSITGEKIKYLEATDGPSSYWHLVISPDRRRIYWSYGND